MTTKRLMKAERARGDSDLEMAGALGDRTWEEEASRVSFGEETILLPASPSLWLLFVEHLLSVIH